MLKNRVAVALGGLFAIANTWEAKADAVVRPNVHHVMVVDVSGSMYSDLPGLRTHLKNKLVSLVEVDDTISIIWFSGRGQFGTLLEGVKIATLKDLTAVHKAIDRYLQAVCLTGFLEPLKEMKALVGRLKENNGDGLVNMFFHTDGYDNQWSEKEILGMCRELAPIVDSSTIVEYGWNCNRKLLAAMAETLGGKLLFSEHFEGYTQNLEEALQGSRGKKVVIELPVKAGQLVFAVDARGNVVTYLADEGKVVVPEYVTQLSYLSDSAEGLAVQEVGPGMSDEVSQAVYGALAVMSQKRMANELYAAMKVLGDVRLSKKFVNCFSKQDYIDFKNMCVAAVADKAMRYADGFDVNALPAEDAPTVMDVLGILQESSDNLLFTGHPEFGYKAIGAARVQKEVEGTDGFKLKFVADESDAGVPVSALVFNESRPNVSVMIRKTGKVALPPHPEYPKVPDEVESFIYRNYTIIRDGVVHTRKLPVKLVEESFNKLKAIGLVQGNWNADEIYVLNLSNTPVINRKMVKSVKAADTFAKVFELEKLKAAQKVFKFYRDEVQERTSATYELLYGVEAAAWLKTIGITDYNGFNPPSTKGEGPDEYMAKFLEIKVEKLSSLPKVSDVETKMNAGKALTLREAVMEDAITRVQEFKASKFYQDAADKATMFNAWIQGEAKKAVEETRKLQKELNQEKFAVVVGQVWFSDLAEDVNSLTFTKDGQTITVTAELTEKAVS